MAQAVLMGDGLMMKNYLVGRGGGARASAVLRPAGHFLCWCKESNQRNTFFLTYGPVRERTSLIRARTARILRAITLATSLRVAGIKNLETLLFTKPGR
jgi:hypothetical protein